MKRYLKYVKPYWYAFILGPILMITEVAGEVILPIALAIGIFSIVYFIYYEVTKYSCYKAAMN